MNGATWIYIVRDKFKCQVLLSKHLWVRFIKAFASVFLPLLIGVVMLPELIMYSAGFAMVTQFVTLSFALKTNLSTKKVIVHHNI